MKKNLYNFLKGIDNLEIKNLKDIENLNKKLKTFKNKFKSKPETIENRLKIIIIDKILEANNQEQFVFKISGKHQK